MWTRRTGLFLSLHMLLKTWYSQEFYIINHLMAGFVTWEIGIRLTASTPCPNILVPKLEILLRHLLTPAGLLVPLTCQKGWTGEDPDFSIWGWLIHFSVLRASYLPAVFPFLMQPAIGSVPETILQSERLPDLYWILYG